MLFLWGYRRSASPPHGIINTYLYSFPWLGGLLGNRGRRSTSGLRTVDRSRSSKQHRNSEICFLDDKFIIRHVKVIIVALQELEDVLQLG